MSQGAVFAFLIPGAGTSIAAIGGALRIARWRVIAIVICTLWLGAIMTGLLFDLLLVIRLISSCLYNGEYKVYLCSYSSFAFSGNAPAMSLHDRLGNCQPQTRFTPLGTRRVSAIEAIKDVRQSLG
jgi:hypothetical protein